MDKLFMPVLAVVFLFASCVSLKHTPQRPDDRAVQDNPPETPASSLEKAYDSAYWVTMPSDTGISVLGIAGRRGKQEEAVAEALADAARRAALYHGVYGESVSVLNQGQGNLDYFSDFDYRLDLLNDFEQYIGKLVFDKDRDVLEKDGAVFVWVQYPGVFDIPVHKTVLEQGVPNWVKNYAADIPGFLTGIGYSNNKGSPQKTHRASYENAIVSLLPRLSSKVGNEVTDVKGNKITQNISTSSGVLEKVLILETWLDRKTNAVWTLLVARQKAP